MSKTPANYHLVRYMKHHVELEEGDQQAILAGIAIMAMVNDLVAPMSPLQSGNYSVMHFNDVEAHARVVPELQVDNKEWIEYQIIDNASDDERRVLISCHYNHAGNFEWIDTFPYEEGEPTYLTFYKRLLGIYEKAFKVTITELKNG